MTQVLAGPYCTQLLGDLGADIVKVEPPAGDGTRSWGPHYIRGESAYFLSLNRNKRSIVVDMTRGRRAREVLGSLAAKCDVFIENFRPGVAKKLGISYGSLRRSNPRLIYCSISGYGQTGPWSARPGYDIAAYAASGIMSITGEPGRPPVKAGVPIADLGAAMFAATAIACCLIERKKTGGCRIDVSMFDSMVSWLTFQAATYLASGEEPRPLGSSHPVIAPYQAFKASDEYFVLAVGNDGLWRKACEALGSEGLANDPRFSTNDSRTAHRQELAGILGRIFSRRKAAHWLQVFERAGVPCSPINSVGSALDSDHSKNRGLVVEIPHPKGGSFRGLAFPVKFASSQTAGRAALRAPPAKGQHTDEVLAEVGYRAGEIARLRREGVVS